MQPLSSFTDSQGSATLLLGAPGGGKTVLGCRLFPRTYVCVTDMNLKSAQIQLERLGEAANVVGIDVIGVDEKGVSLGLQQRYPRLIKAVDEAEKNPEVETIFHDSMSTHAPIFMGKLTLASKISDVDWNKDKAGPYLRLWQSFIDQSRTSGKRVVFSVHERVAEDQMQGKILFNQINLWGGLRDAIPYMVADVWRCEVQPPTTPNGKPQYMVRVVKDFRNPSLKNSYGWDEPLLSQDEVVKRVRATLKPHTK